MVGGIYIYEICKGRIQSRTFIFNVSFTKRTGIFSQYQIWLRNREASLSFWKDLRSQRQQRYSSRARVSGSMEMYDNTERVVWSRDNISTYGSRDHNWGISDWSLFIRRYI